MLVEYGRRAALAGNNPYRSRAYLRAAESLAAQAEPLARLVEEDRLCAIPGVGDAIADIITKLYETGMHPSLEKMRQQGPRRRSRHAVEIPEIIDDDGTWRRGNGPGRRRRNPVSARLGETASGIRRVVRTDRDEHAGRAATGGQRASGRDLHQERLSRHSLLQLYRSYDASCARDPAKSGNRRGRASILFVAFCPRVLNIRHATGYLVRRTGGPEGMKSEPLQRSRALCPIVLAHSPTMYPHTKSAI